MKSRVNSKRKLEISQIILNLVFVLICACYILPFMMVITISLSDFNNVMAEGFKIFPTEIDFTAYKLIFNNFNTIMQAYKVTIGFTVLHTALSTVLTALIAWPISRPYFKGRKLLTWYIFITMLFHAGMIPSYLTNVKLLGLGNKFLIYVFPGLVGAWNVMIVRTFYMGLPEEMLEASRIDGAGEFQSFIKIIVPLAKPSYATIGFMTLVNKWNDWNTTLVYIRDKELYSLQYLLQRMLREVEEFEKMLQGTSFASDMQADAIPSEPMRFAMALIAAGPILLTFPWFQRYFAKGMTIGAVKG